MPINAFSPEKNFLKWSKSEVINFLNRAEFVGQAAWYIENILNPAEAIDIFSNPNLPADVIQAILQHEIVSLHKLIKIITYDANDLTVSSDTTLSGVNRYKGLAVSATLTIDDQPGVLICDYLKSNGTILKTKTGGAGGSSTCNGVGGAGAGGLIIITNFLVNSGLIDASGEAGSDGENTGSNAGGGDGGDGKIIKIFSDSEGSGGDGAIARGLGNFGGGGGGTSALAGGDGGSSTIITKSSPTELYNEIKYALIDWWMINILEKNPTSTISFPDIKGAGGGGGARYSTGASGGGGGSGGEVIILASELFDNTGTIQANGGNGGNGDAVGDWDGSGGGGGGGLIYIFTKKVINQGTIQALGGARGPSGDYLGEDGSDGTVSLFNIQL